MPRFGDIELDVLRGWDERGDVDLRGDHRLPALGRLVGLQTGRVATIHGPDVLVGRYQPRHGPVDIILGGLDDHERYRLGAPHVYLSLDTDSGWSLEGISPGYRTLIDDQPLVAGGGGRSIENGADVTLGRVTYRFETASGGLDTWNDARTRLLNEADGPALFLCRQGGPCGPYIRWSGLQPAQPDRVVIGRHFPDGATVGAHDRWDEHARPDWNLAGLWEEERIGIAFEHAHLVRRAESLSPDQSNRDGRRGGQLQIVPIAERHKTFVNRLEIIDATPVSAGDEVALGTVIFYVHRPHGRGRPVSKGLRPPAVIDWREASPPVLDDSREDQ